MNKIEGQSGFTIIELLVYISILSLLSTIFLGFAGDVFKNSRKLLAFKEVMQNNQLLKARIDQEVKGARNVKLDSASKITVTRHDSSILEFYYDTTAKAVFLDSASIPEPIRITNTNISFSNFTFSSDSPDAGDLDILKVDYTIADSHPIPGTGPYEIKSSHYVVPREKLYQ